VKLTRGKIMSAIRIKTEKKPEDMIPVKDLVEEAIEQLSLEYPNLSRSIKNISVKNDEDSIDICNSMCFSSHHGIDLTYRIDGNAGVEYEYDPAREVTLEEIKYLIQINMEELETDIMQKMVELYLANYTDPNSNLGLWHVKTYVDVNVPPGVALMNPYTAYELERCQEIEEAHERGF
jgi:hypothetical protein